MIMVDIVSNVPQQVEKSEITSSESTTKTKRTKVLQAIATLEKNKIPASNDKIIRQINDDGLQRKEVLEIISQLYVDGVIKKSKGNFKVTKPRRRRVIETSVEHSAIPEPPLATLMPPAVPILPTVPMPPATSASSASSEVPTTVIPATPQVMPPSGAPALPAAGVTIPHDGLPTISSVHSYQAGKTMSFPVGKVEETEKLRYVHPWQILPRYIQPGGKVVYHPGMPSRFVHPAQMIPIHIPHGGAMPEPPPPGIQAFPPPAYYPLVPGQQPPDGKPPVQWVFYPVSIPVNAVRPFIQEKSPKSSGEEEPSDPPLAKLKSPENITSDMIDSVPTMESEATMSKAVADIHPRNSLKSASQCSDKAKYVAEDFNKASSLLRDQGPSRSTTVTSSTNATNYSTTDGKDNLTEEINRLSAKHPREALLTKKRKQLSGIVDRVTEVAASKQNIEEQRKSLSNGDNVARSSSGTPPTRPVVNDESSKIETGTFIYAQIGDGKHTAHAFHPRFSLLPKPKETEEEKGQRLKEFSSLDNVRNILKAPPDFIKNPVHPPPASTSTSGPPSTDSPVFIHPRKILYNNCTPPVVRKTPEPNAFEQKIITEVNNSIKSLHSMNPKNRNSPIAHMNNSNDSSDIFRELERNAIKEAQEFSKRMNENAQIFPTNSANVHSKNPRLSLDRRCGGDSSRNEDVPSVCTSDTLDSESEEYHALKEISILQSANNPITMNTMNTMNTLTTYAPSLMHVTRCVSGPLSRRKHVVYDERIEGINDVTDDNDSDYEIISDDDSEVEEEDDDDEDYETLYDLIRSSNCSNDDYKTLYIFNPNLILDDVLKCEKYKHLLPPMESDETDDDELEESEPETIISERVPPQEDKLKEYPIRHKIDKIDLKEPEQNKTDLSVTEQGKTELNKTDLNKSDVSEADLRETEDETLKRRKNGEKYKELPPRSDREKRCRVDVFYKVTRTNFMNAPSPKKTRKSRDK